MDEESQQKIDVIELLKWRVDALEALDRRRDLVVRRLSQETKEKSDATERLRSRADILEASVHGKSRLIRELEVKVARMEGEQLGLMESLGDFKELPRMPVRRTSGW